MNRNRSSQRGVWLAIILLASLCIAAVAAGLFHAAGAEPTATLGASGVAFLGVASFGLAAHRFLTE
ncbi:type II secretory pathway component PulK [Streptomyces achromogenes]|uniref:Type II secretory pathway component PulK n=1 Tax=Streptomyces achromogenes TaxID=67255 RepID=A0ABU0Q4X7_STRAH|nr:hypothetical protein [Streptomyces achromogenes]MDQ0685649.1 type II secretory pathway component PulK [Streptomyces achromogenes]